jgi:hypothetical protein
VGCLLGEAPLHAAEPAATPAAQAKKHDAPAPPPDPLAEARKQMKVLYDGVAHIQRALDAAGKQAVRASCVEERLADARAHLRLGGDEVARLEASLTQGKRPADAADAELRARALMRLEMLAARTREVEHAAEICVGDDRSAIDVTEVRVDIAPVPTADESAGQAAPVSPPR